MLSSSDVCAGAGDGLLDGVALGKRIVPELPESVVIREYIWKNTMEEENGSINPYIPSLNYKMCRQRNPVITFTAVRIVMISAEEFSALQRAFKPEIIDSSEGIDAAVKQIEQMDNALNQRIPGTNPSREDLKAAFKKILEEKSRIAHTEREFGSLVGGKRNQNRTDEAKLNFIQSVGNTLIGDLADQPGLAKTYAILFRNRLNANLPSCERWKNFGSTMSLKLRNVLKKVLSMPFRDPNIVCSGLGLKSTSKVLAVVMELIVLFGNTTAVGAVRAMAPEAAAPGSWDFEQSSNFAFGVINSVGAVSAVLGVFIAFKWRRRHSIAGTSAASAPAAVILNRPVIMAQTLTVLRSWRETEYCEVILASQEEGAYAS